MEKTKRSSETTNRAIWDCESCLYDSFELKSLKKQLDSAIVSRTLSMPHLSDSRLPPPPANKKQASKISRSFRRLIRAVFGPKLNSGNNKNTAIFGKGYGLEHSKEGFYVVYDRSAALSTIPEVPEFDGLSPEIRSLVRRSASERFSAAASLGISCS